MRVRAIAWIASVGGLLGALLLAPVASGASGDLDPSFSDDGKMWTEVRGKPASAGAVLADGGSIIVGGQRWVTDERTRPFVLALEEGGRRVSSFGKDGVVRLPVWSSEARPRHPVEALERLSDGSILAAVSSGFETYVFKLGDGGALDAGFGGDGRLELPAGDIRSSPRLLAAPGGGFYALWGDVVRRYTDAGGLDPGFAPIDGSQTPIADVALLPTGHLLTLEHPGRYERGSPDYMIARWDEEGVLDTSFGDQGRADGSLRPALPGGGPTSSRHTLLLGASGAFYVAAGSFINPPYGSIDLPTFARHLADGTQDPDWGEDGAVLLGYSDGGKAFAIGPDEMPVATGGVDCGRGAGFLCFDLTAARVDRDGAPDRSFGPGGGEPGSVRYDLDRRRGDWGYAVDVDGAGRIVIAGAIYDDGGPRLTVVRLLSEPGQRDRDADGLPDADDRCPGAFGPRERHGCPRFRRRVKRMTRYRPDSGSPPMFRGVIKAGHPDCRAAEVSIRRRRRRGADREIAVAETYASQASRTDPGVFEVRVPRGYRGPRSPAVHAVAKRSLEGAGICRRDRSPALRRGAVKRTPGKKRGKIVRPKR